ncbi:MAG TPA: hypothetical protein VF755_25360 [Catenuloplanes sp.]
MTSPAKSRGHAPRRMRVSPAWVGAPRPGPGTALFDRATVPAREAAWMWSMRRFARTAIWTLPVAALAYGWTTLGVADRPGPLAVRLAGIWLALVAQVALTALLAGTATRRAAVAGLLTALAAAVVLLPLAALAPGAAPAGVPLNPADLSLAIAVATGVQGLSWLLTGWAIFRSGLLNPADGILLMLAAAVIGAGAFAVNPLPTVGALLMLAAGTGVAVTGGRLLPRS